MDQSNNLIQKPSKKLPLLVWTDDVVLPGSLMKIPLTSTKDIETLKSKILKKDNEGRSLLGIIYKSPDKEEEVKDSIGTLVRFQGAETTPYRVSLVVYGLRRIRVEQIIQVNPYIVGHISEVEGPSNDSIDSSLIQALFKKILKYQKLSHISFNLPEKIKDKTKLELLIDVFSSILPALATFRLKILSTLDLKERLKMLIDMLDQQQQVIHLLKNPDQLPEFKQLRPAKLSIVKNSMHRSISEEEESWIRRIKEANLPENVLKIVREELSRMLCNHNSESQVIRNYLNLVLSLPWNKSSEEKIDIHFSKKILDKYHFGMDKQKRRILEYLAVKRLKPNAKGPILCFSGPPGTGKTSMATCIAEAIGKKFYRIALGGVHNHTTIRGHSRTYIASQPGTIIQALRHVETNNPVILLDEIDKLASEKFGDPAAALLEVLDPEQNCKFVDHYLNIPFDLSKVMFIGTANSTAKMPEALLDRLEVIPINGYSIHEKISIAEQHLIPKQILENGLLIDKLTIPNKSVELIIDGYTREAGVRNLERSIASICRYIAYTHPPPTSMNASENIRENISKDEYNELFKNETLNDYNLITINDYDLDKILGPPIFTTPNYADRLRKPGACLGLAHNNHGGSVLVIEAIMMDGTGKIKFTGSLGDVIKESINIAFAWLRNNAIAFDLDLSWSYLSKYDIHIHFPSGAVSKEGPSAGIAITTALLSLFSQRHVRSDIAFTGEITLNGLVLPVGGLPGKILAAQRAGLNQVVIPNNCESELADIPEEHLQNLLIHKVSNIEEVIDLAFEGGLNSFITNENIARNFYPSKL